MRPIMFALLIAALTGLPLFADVPNSKATAEIDLGTPAGIAAVQGQWRYSDARIIEVPFREVGADNKPTGKPNRTYDIVPHAGVSGFDDGSWEVIAPTTLGQRRGHGKVSFDWYRLKVTLPARIGTIPTAGMKVQFEVVVDDYAEVWVNGKLPRELGQRGGTVVAGFNAPNRVLLTERAQPGQQFQLAVFGINGPISASPENYIYIRSARLTFEPPEVRIVRNDARFDQLVSPDVQPEKIASGFRWVEGPVWDRKGQRLLFTDIPANSIHAWKQGAGARLMLKPSGYTGTEPFSGREPGANGLTFDPQGRLVWCAHGDRCIYRLEADGTRTKLVSRFQGRRINSPNDLVFKSDGDLYFTDPPYGLPRTFEDPQRELSFCGVYRLKLDGTLTLLTDKVKAPNGIVFSPDEKTLYVSDVVRAVWWAFPVQADGTLGEGRVFFDAMPWTANHKGAPDGIKVDHHGNLFTAGPGGVHVFAPDGTHLGSIAFDVPVSNCAWGEDGSTLFITADTAVWRIRLRTKGAGY